MGQAFFPDRSEFGAIITDQFRGMTGQGECLWGHPGDPLTGFVQASDGGQGRARIIINQNANVTCGVITQFRLFQVNMPLLMGTFRLIPPVTNALGLAFEGISLDRYPQSLKNVRHRLPSQRPDTSPS